ncbi:protein LBH [Sylvia atricapilla]|uniref:protein LBH n=1 Tax=Sylvia atricapilla TaxID=48155 RepID=UPI0033959419
MGGAGPDHAPRGYLRRCGGRRGAQTGGGGRGVRGFGLSWAAPRIVPPRPAVPGCPSRHPPARGSLCCDFMSVLCPLPCSDYLRSAEMTEVMMNTPAMDEIGLSPRKDGLSYQIFPDPSDFDRYCKLKDRLPSIVVEPTEGDVESGELRWPPEEFLVQEEDEEEEEENCEDAKKDNKEQ